VASLCAVMTCHVQLTRRLRACQLARPASAEWDNPLFKALETACNAHAPSAVEPLTAMIMPYAFTGRGGVFALAGSAVDAHRPDTNAATATTRVARSTESPSR